MDQSQKDTFIWYVSAKCNVSTASHPYSYNYTLKTPIELLNNQTRWKKFRFRRYFPYGGSAGTFNTPMATLTIPSRTAQLTFAGNNGTTEFQYVSSLIQSATQFSGTYGPWSSISCDYIPSIMTLTLSSLPGFGTISSAFNFIIEMEWTEDIDAV